MRRRACLEALLAGCAGWPAQGRATPGDLLLHGPNGAGLLSPTQGLRALPSAVTPVAAGDGLWTTSADGDVQRWRRATDGTWSVVATCRVPEPVHLLAASADGGHAAAAHGERLTVLGADGTVLARFEGRDLQRRRHGSAQALFALAGRRSFVAAWPALGELWEISLDPAAEPIYDGLVHDYRLREGLPRPGWLGARRTPLALPMPRIEFADAGLPWVAGRDEAEGGAGAVVAIVHLDVRRRVASLPLPGARPGDGALRLQVAGASWWLPAGDHIHVVDARRWTVQATHAAPASVHGLRTLGAQVAARVGDPGRLLLWRDERWQAVEGLGAVSAIGADAVAGHWLVAAGTASVVHRIGLDGQRIASVPLPGPMSITGLQALSA